MAGPCASLLPPALLLWSLGVGLGCPGPEEDRELVLAKVRTLLLEGMGSADPGDAGDDQARARTRTRRHDPGPREGQGEDLSQIILFPAPGVDCREEPESGGANPGPDGLLAYVFRPSHYTRRRRPTAAELWFYTGPRGGGPGEANASAPATLLTPSPAGEPEPVLASPGPAGPDWAVLRLAAPSLSLLSRPALVLLLRCPACPRPSGPDTSPFLTAHTRARGPSEAGPAAGGAERARRSPHPRGPPDLLQLRPEEPTAHPRCRRASLNISFEELGWDRWIVHPASFLFHYCHGDCGEDPGPAPVPLPRPPGVRACCAALPGTMRALRVRTTSDGGDSFKYETVPNMLAQHCACL
ncbi:inhibin alpha chain [Ornithorhynchus anatinus]|uniref:Inhibin alpha chain n=1 Tax=Ornithorhynchus anatinus TaxID=9258 RepID=A0A6I8MXM2_ORNAN|nr:inhibin alpha chain [Ornithorhynchus anatinus]